MSERQMERASTSVAAANFAALATLVPIALYQLHVVEHLPDPPNALFASEEITMSKAAHPLGIPDGLLGLGSFAVTLGLALSARRHKRLRKLLLLKVAVDTGVAAVNVVRQVVSFGKLCSWCTGTAACAFLAAASSAPMVREELRRRR